MVPVGLRLPKGCWGWTVGPSGSGSGWLPLAGCVLSGYLAGHLFANLLVLGARLWKIHTVYLHGYSRDYVDR